MPFSNAAWASSTVSPIIVNIARSASETGEMIGKVLGLENRQVAPHFLADLKELSHIEQVQSSPKL